MRNKSKINSIIFTDFLNVVSVIIIFFCRYSKNIKIIYRTDSFLEKVYLRLLATFDFNVSFVEATYKDSNFRKANELKTRLLERLNIQDEFLRISHSFHFWPHAHAICYAYCLMQKEKQPSLLIWGDHDFGLRGLDSNLALIQYFWPISVDLYKFPVSSLSTRFRSGFWWRAVKTGIKLVLKRRNSDKVAEYPVLFVSPDRSREKNLYLSQFFLSFPRFDVDSGQIYKGKTLIGSIYQCGWREFWNYLISLYLFICQLGVFRGLSKRILLQALMDFKFNYFFVLYMQKAGTSVLLNNFEGSSFSVFSNWAARRSDNTIALNYSWSHGYFPEHRCCLNKYADIYLAWGQYQETLVKESAEGGIECLQVGYPGDLHFSRMRESALSIIDNIGSLPKIAVFDNVHGIDHFLHSVPDEKFYCKLGEIFAKTDCLFLVRSKKDAFRKVLERVKGFKDNVRTASRVILFPEKGDAGPGLVADIIVCHSLSSLATIAGSWGARTIIYDPEAQVNPKLLNSNFYVARTSEEFFSTLQEVLEIENMVRKEPNKIDPFLDGKAVQRIQYIIDRLLETGGDSKSARIQYCQHLYKRYCSQT